MKTFFIKLWDIYKRGLKPAFIVGIILGIFNILMKMQAGFSILLIVDFLFTVGMTTFLWPLMLLWLIILPGILLFVSLV